VKFGLDSSSVFVLSFQATPPFPPMQPILSRPCPRPRSSGGTVESASVRTVGLKGVMGAWSDPAQIRVL